MDTTLKGRATRTLPQPTPDTGDTVARFGRYGDQTCVNLCPDMLGLSDEGSYFTAIVNNGTVGTGIKFTADATTAFTDGNGGVGLVLQNSDTNSSATIGKRIYIDYIKLMCSAAVAGNTNYNMVAKIDNVLSKYTSGGTVPSIWNSNMDAPNNSIAKVAFGAPVVVASSSGARMVWRQVCRTTTTTPGINDVITIVFGSVEKPVAAMPLFAAAGSELAFAAPPIVLGPGHTFSLHSWGASQSTAPTFECEMGWWER